MSSISGNYVLLRYPFGYSLKVRSRDKVIIPEDKEGCYHCQTSVSGSSIESCYAVSHADDCFNIDGCNVELKEKGFAPPGKTTMH